MKTYTVKRYSFNELNAEAQAAAIENERKCSWESFPDFLMEEDMNFKAASLLSDDIDVSLSSDTKVFYSLSYCQGDGARLDGRIFKTDAPNLPWPENAAYLDIDGDSRYYHHRSFSVEIYDEEGEYLDDLNSSMLEALRDICVKLERYGYKWIEDWNSEERIREELQERDPFYTLEGDWKPLSGEVEEVA